MHSYGIQRLLVTRYLSPVKGSETLLPRLQASLNAPGITHLTTNRKHAVNHMHATEQVR